MNATHVLCLLIVEQPSPPLLRSSVSGSTIHLSWVFSKECLETVECAYEITWRSVSDVWTVTRVLGSSYDITEFLPGVEYSITVVAVCDGVRSEEAVLTVTPSCKLSPACASILYHTVRASVKFSCT